MEKLYWDKVFQKRHKIERDERSGKKNPEKQGQIIPHFNDVAWLIFETLCPAAKSLDATSQKSKFNKSNLCF